MTLWILRREMKGGDADETKNKDGVQQAAQPRASQDAMQHERALSLGSYVCDDSMPHTKKHFACGKGKCSYELRWLRARV